MADVIRVRYMSGTHQTNTIRGQRASSTMGYELAAIALCRKLFPEETVALVRRGSAAEAGLEVFEVRRRWEKATARG